MLRSHQAHLALAAIACLMQCTPVELRTMQYTSRSRPEAIQWQEELRGELLRLLKISDLVSGETDIPFNAEVLDSEERAHHTYMEVEIDSTPGRRIELVLTIPNDSSGPHPAVVCIHGHKHDRYAVYKKNYMYRKFAKSLANSGYVTISVDVGQHKAYEEDRIVMGERLWDLMRCVDYLESLPEVDRSRIGCAGMSLGGEMAMWLSAMDERIRTTVSSGFLTRMDHIEDDHCSCWKFDGLRELVDFADIYSLSAPRPLMCQSGLEEPEIDFYVPIAREAMSEIEIIYEDLGRSGNVVHLVHEGGHVVDLSTLESFLEDNLKYPRDHTVPAHPNPGLDEPLPGVLPGR